MEKQYKYDAFISYRHCELDKFVAENLSRILETYELPLYLKEKLKIEGKSFKRIFRDQDELPLSSNLEDPILDALNNSKYLIVICSPRLKDSLWCKKEIETFKKIRGRKNILCVLIEGEPDDSFPEEVLFEEVVEKGKKVKKPVEPLAADVRGITKKEVLKKIKEEKLRLAAAMYHIDYDDLKQRQKLREQKRKMTILSIVSAAAILFTLYTSIMLIKINNQQKMLKKHQAITLSSKANNYLKKDKRYDAIKSSYQALTKFNGVKMPYTSNAEYALSESLGVYNIGSSYKAISDLKTNGVVSFIRGCENSKYGAIYDEGEEVTLFNTNDLKVINKYDVSGTYYDEHSFTFIGNNLFAFVNKNGDISIINIKDNKMVKEIKKEKNSFISLKGDPKGTYLVYSEFNKLYIYNIKENKVINTITNHDSFIKSIYYSENSDYIFVGTQKENFNINAEDYITMHVINTKDGKEINSIEFNASYITGMQTKNNNVYMLFNTSVGINNNILLVSYNYIDGNTNWSKTIENKWAKYITRSYEDGKNHVTIATHDSVMVFDEDNGNELYTYNLGSEIINTFSFLEKEVYLVFLKNGHVKYINTEYNDSVEYKGKYVLNLDDYSKVITSEQGFIMIPTNDNRIILYRNDMNKNLKELGDVKEFKKAKSIYKDYDKLKESYNMKNKSLIENMFYDNKKKLLFVNYTNNDLAIYDVDSKKLLKTISNIGKIDTYYGMDIYGRIYIGDLSDSYVLDKDYNKVSHIENLYKVEKNNIIIKKDGKYYSSKIYKLNDLLKDAENYLK